MFRIIEVPHSSASSLEQLGTKPKFWFDQDSTQMLWKEGREGTGENWSEVVASELCKLLCIPSADYYFAEHDGRRGVVTPNFVPSGGRLIHGNELLAAITDEYRSEERYYHQRQHTLRIVLTVLRPPPIAAPIGANYTPQITLARDMFLGYLMFDALIGNSDRHHENWGLILTKEGNVHLAPTYDHASSLGRNESDDTRCDILNTKDARRSITSFVRKARSAFYQHKGDTRSLLTHDVFMEAAKYSPVSAFAWLEKLEGLSMANVDDIFRNIPPEYISPLGAEFALNMIRLNLEILLELKGTIQ